MLDIELENLKHNLIFYPNPTQNLFTISSDKVINSTFSIFDAKGREVLAGIMKGQKHVVDISKLSKGIYTVVFNDQNTPILKIAKE